MEGEIFEAGEAISAIDRFKGGEEFAARSRCWDGGEEGSLRFVGIVRGREVGIEKLNGGWGAGDEIVIGGEKSDADAVGRVIPVESVPPLVADLEEIAFD